MSKTQQIQVMRQKGYSHNCIARSVGTSASYVGRVLARQLSGCDLRTASDYWAFGYGTHQIATCMRRPDWQIYNSLEQIKQLDKLRAAA